MRSLPAGWPTIQRATTTPYTIAMAAQAMKALYLDTHNVAEGAGAASLAAALQRARTNPGEIAGRCVGLTLCGGNVDHEVFAQVLGAPMPA